MTTALAALALLLATGAEPRVLAVDPAGSAVRFHVNHKLHTVDGVSRSVEGKAIVDADGAVKTMIRVPVQSFDSGDRNRDSHMLETLEGGRYPHVTFKGVGRLDGGAAPGKSVQVALKGELEFHGVKQPVEVTCTVEFAADGSARVKGRFVVSLDAHHVDRPSLLTIKIDDACAVDLDLALRRT